MFLNIKLRLEPWGEAFAFIYYLRLHHYHSRDYLVIVATFFDIPQQHTLYPLIESTMGSTYNHQPSLVVRCASLM